MGGGPGTGRSANVVTASLAPSLLIGSAPPANAPPGVQTTGASSKDPSTSTGDTPPGSFAALLQSATHEGAATQTGGEPATPPSGGTPASEAPPTEADLLAQLIALAQGIETDGVPSGPASETSANLLLDRLAEAGGPEDQTDDAAGVVEALMAYLVMAQPAQAQPNTATAVPDDLAALIQGIEGVLGAAGSEPTDAAASLGSVAELGPLGPIGEESVPVIPEVDAATDAADLGAELVADVTTASVADETTNVAVEPTATAEVLVAPVKAEPRATAAGDLASAEAAQRSVERVAAATSSEARDGATDGGSDDDTGAPRVEARHINVTASSHATPEAAAAAAVNSTLPAPSAPARVEVASQAAGADGTSPAEVADFVHSASLNGDSDLRLVLNPPELGHLDIHIVRGEHGLRITLEASQSGAREFLDRSMAGLHHALEARDLRVDRLEVKSTDAGRGSLDTSAGGQQSGGGASSGSQGEDTPEWSPVARFERMTEPARQSTASEQSIVTGAVAGAGSVDLLA